MRKEYGQILDIWKYAPPDTERAESVSTRGGNWPDQGLVADATGEDCGQASQLRCRLAQRFWHLNCGFGFVDGYPLDLSYFVKI